METNYQRLTQRNVSQMRSKEQRLQELENMIEDGMLVFIDKPFYAKDHQCWCVYQKDGEIVQTLFTTEEQAKNYKALKR